MCSKSTRQGAHGLIAALVMGSAIVGSALYASARPATISPGGANNICSHHGGMQSGSWGSGCGWCGPNTCSQVTCNGGKCNVAIVKVTASAKAPVNRNGPQHPVSTGASIYSRNSSSVQNIGTHAGAGAMGGARR
jgi:hypothetical protein